ncbi:aspartate ammonia-lyase [Citrobacter amalonaticus]|uniref:Aspartate ammonia-lyase n=2 Tax=Citrobacter amalonaticus TaxID=35703 RepID=A0A2S4S107_CITAM|nr:aspartate ammonia-lyase [Citrobacter amalonaticus]POT78252.1 aspartate ammonia-lyase [Citrobacter amalonaticus]POU67082.1 aspartate ammonia-lyase [Citrobacter amalonaticus]POV06286.1 aspartate ammonia-lyase [Citrobacter amalonaticus]
MREEKDLLGCLMVPDDAYYGIQTQRAVLNFSVSGRTAVDIPHFLWSIAAIKQAAAQANGQIGALDQEKAAVIVEASREVMAGAFDAHFPVDIFQGGGGTSTNMNMNEVLANRANEILTGVRGYEAIHPNTHVNMGQSTNDVIPAAMKMTSRKNINHLIVQLEKLEAVLAEKSRQFASKVKLGRTCLQDAVPMTFGQQFGAYCTQVRRLKENLTQVNEDALSLPLGATAIGTGLSTHEGYLPAVYSWLEMITGEKYRPEADFFDGLQHGDFYIEFSAQLKKIAAFLSKMATDFRIQGSGPRAGFNEIIVPAVQPGSSIMPGKINPVMPELVNQIAYQVIGNDLTVTMAVEGAELDLNVWEPVLLKALFESCSLLSRVIPLFIDKCLADITINEAVSARYAEQSTALATIVATLFGYQVGSRIAKAAYEQQCSVRQVVLAEKLLTPAQADYLLDPLVMTDPQKSTAAIKRYKKEMDAQ